MIRQRALAWAAVLAIVVALQMASLPIQPLAAGAASLAQDSPDVEAGQPTDLAVVALHCAAAPAAEALTSFFSTGAVPTGCAPAVGVSIAVTENGSPHSGSPFTTDASGTLGVRVGLGSSVTLREDPESLPTGYEPLTQEANGVPYANPVQLDSAAAGTAALFVNVPASVAATLNQGAQVVDAGEPTDLVAAVAPNRTGCDPAYPDERTCIPSGSPLDAPCSITDERNFTVLPPDPRDLDADGDGIGCEPISTGGGTTSDRVNVTLYDSGDSLPVAPVSNGNSSVAASPDRIGDGVWVLPPDRNRADHWLVLGDRNRADDWLVHRDRSNNGILAIVSNSVVIGNGVWRWEGHHRHDNEFWLNHITIGNFTIARSSNGSLAIVSNSVFIGNGFWTLFGQREDNGLWLNRIVIGNLTIARSSNGSLAIVSNPVFVGDDLRTWGGHHRDDNWLAQEWSTRAHAPDVELLAINGRLGVESPSSTPKLSSSTEQPVLTINGALTVSLPADSIVTPSDAAVASPPSDDAVASPPSDDAVAVPPDDPAVETPPSDAAAAPVDNSVAPPPDDGYVAPAPSDSYIEPPSDNTIQPPPPDAAVAPPVEVVQPPDASVAPPPDAAVAPPSDGYVESPTSDTGAPDPGNISPNPVEAAPDVDPGYVMPDPIDVGPGNGDTGSGEFANAAPDLISVAPGNGDFGVDPGSGDSGNVMPNSGDVAPDPVGVDSGNGDSGVDSGSERGGEDG
jgi:hypothetical protein